MCGRWPVSAVRAGKLVLAAFAAGFCCLLCCLWFFFLWQFGDKRDRHTRLAACVACRPAVREAGQCRGRGWRAGSVWFLRLFFRLVLIIPEEGGGSRPTGPWGSGVGSLVWGAGHGIHDRGRGHGCWRGRLLAQLGCVCVSVPCAFANLLAASCSQRTRCMLSSDVPAMHEQQAGIHAMAVSHAELRRPWKTGRMGPWDHPGTLRANRAGAVSVRAGGSGLGPPLEGFETTPHILWIPS